jgi:hypothetical protein
VPEYVLPFPFAVVDAGMREYFSQEDDSSSPTVRRQRTTAGSAQYFLIFSRGEETVELLSFSLRAVAQNQTFIVVRVRRFDPSTIERDMLDYLRRFACYQLFAFISWFWVDQKQMAALIAKAPTPDNTLVVSDDLLVLVPGAIQSIARDTGGRPRQVDDDWAWHQVYTHGRERGAVRKEWRQRNKASGRILNDEKRSWNNAMEPDRIKN